MVSCVRYGRFMLLAVLLLATASAAGQTPRSDLKKLQGTWVCVATLKDGKEVKTYVGVKAVFKGNDLFWFFPQKDGSFREQKNRFRIDASKRPKQFDWWREDKTAKEADRRVYTLDGDTLRMATNLDYKTRPKSMDSAVWHFTVKRVREK